MGDNAYTPRRTTWDPKWAGDGLGTSMEIDPAVKLQLEPIVRGTTGKIVLGYWIIGIEGSIKCNLPDVSPTLLAKLAPWTAGANAGSLPLHPVAFQANLYDFAQMLILHPHDMGADVTQDLHFPKAAPVSTINMKRAGTADDVWVVEFMVLPDLAQLQTATPKLVMGYMGATAP